MIIVRLVMRDGSYYQVHDPFPKPPGPPLPSQTPQKIGAICSVPRTIHGDGTHEYDAHYIVMSMSTEIDNGKQPDGSHIAYQIHVAASDVLYPVYELSTALQMALVSNRHLFRYHHEFETGGLPEPDPDEPDKADKPDEPDDDEPEEASAAADG